MTVKRELEGILMHIFNHCGDYMFKRWVGREAILATKCKKYCKVVG
jgi:hypothetical protein